MKKNAGNTVAIVTEITKPITDSLGLTIWDIEFEKEGSIWILRIIIDKEGGVSVDDCEAVSRPLDAKLDELDPIEQSYCLEVSSAGIERRLSKEWHFAHCMGEKIVLRLIRPYNGEKEFIGELIGYEENKVTIKTKKDTYIFAISETAFIRLYVEF